MIHASLQAAGRKRRRMHGVRARPQSHSHSHTAHTLRRVRWRARSRPPARPPPCATHSGGRRGPGGGRSHSHTATRVAGQNHSLKARPLAPLGHTLSPYSARATLTWHLVQHRITVLALEGVADGIATQRGRQDSGLQGRDKSRGAARCGLQGREECRRAARSPHHAGAHGEQSAHGSSRDNF